MSYTVFFIEFIGRLYYVTLLRCPDPYVAAAAVAIRLKPRPTIRVLSAGKTQAMTELSRSELHRTVLHHGAPLGGNEALRPLYVVSS